MSDNNGYPSMTALLALLAVAGFQNRDKLTEWFGGGAQQPAPQGAPGTPPADRPDAPDGAYEDFRNQAGAGGIGGALTKGIGELVDRFRQAGQGEVADSWVSQGQNRPVETSDLEKAIGPEGIDMLTRKTGLSREELLGRLSRDLPAAVDRYTPEGRLAAG